jgi:hypothetical protein
VELSANGSDDLGQASLDRCVDVLVAGSERENSAVELRRDRIEAATQLVGLRGGDDRATREHARVRLRLGYVVAPKTTVEVQRSVDRLEVGVLWLSESRHRGRPV